MGRETDLRWDVEVGEKPPLVLVIEDRPEHIAVIEQVLSKREDPCEVVAIASTQAALDFLHGQNDVQNDGQNDVQARESNREPNRAPNRDPDSQEQSRRPDLILMNVHISAGDGSALLTHIKSDASLRRIPTILLTHRTDSDEILKSYQQQCNCYVIKPQELDRLSEVISVIESFWLNIVTLPAE